LLEARGRGHARLTGARVLIDQYQYGELAGPQVEPLQGMIEIGEYHDLRPAQCVVHIAAEWRQFHSSPRTTNRILPAPGRPFGPVGPVGQYAARHWTKLDAERAFCTQTAEKRMLPQ